MRDDSGTVYADGVKMLGCKNTPERTIIPRATRVIGSEQRLFHAFAPESGMVTGRHRATTTADGTNPRLTEL